MGHVAHAVDVDQEADAGDDQQQHGGQRVEGEAPIDHEAFAALGEGTQRHPLPDRDLGVALAGGQPAQLPHRAGAEQERGADRGAADQAHRPARDATAEETVDRHPDQGQQRDQPDQFEHGAPTTSSG